MNKPVGYVSGQAEDNYKPAIVLVTPNNQYKGDKSEIRFNRGQLDGMAPAGRLDIDSTGLLVLTQDGLVARQLIGAETKVEKEYLQGESIIKEGTQIRDFSYLKSGLVKLFRSDQSGKEQIITIAKPMDYVSLLSVFSNDRYNYSVTALEDSVTCDLKMDDVRTMINENGKLALNLLQKMSGIADKIIIDTLDIRKKQLSTLVALIS